MNLSKIILLSHLLTFIQAAIAKVSDAKDKELKVLANYHTKLIKKIEIEKVKSVYKDWRPVRKGRRRRIQY